MKTLRKLLAVSLLLITGFLSAQTFDIISDEDYTAAISTSHYPDSDILLETIEVKRSKSLTPVKDYATGKIVEYQKYNSAGNLINFFAEHKKLEFIVRDDSVVLEYESKHRKFGASIRYYSVETEVLEENINGQVFRDSVTVYKSRTPGVEMVVVSDGRVVGKEHLAQTHYTIFTTDKSVYTFKRN
jgi:hypothetical protein